MRRTKDFGKRWGSGHRARWRGRGGPRGGEDEGMHCVRPRRNERNQRSLRASRNCEVLHSDSRNGTSRSPFLSRSRHLRFLCVDSKGKEKNILHRENFPPSPFLLYCTHPFSLTSFLFHHPGVAWKSSRMINKKRAAIRLEGGETAVIFNQTTVDRAIMN